MHVKLKISKGNFSMEAEGSEGFVLSVKDEFISKLNCTPKEKSDVAEAGLETIEEYIDSSKYSLKDMETVLSDDGELSREGLFLAAAAQLTFGRGVERFSEEDLKNEAMTSNLYVPKNHGSGFAKIVKKLKEAKSLSPKPNNQLSLSNEERLRIEELLKQLDG